MTTDAPTRRDQFPRIDNPDNEPQEWRNLNGDVQWQPRLQNGQLLWEPDVWSFTRRIKPGTGNFTIHKPVLHKSKRRAVTEGRERDIHKRRNDFEPVN